MRTAAPTAPAYVARSGDVLRRRHSAELELCEIHRAPDLYLRPHRHDHATLSAVVAGDGREVVGGDEHRCRWPTVLYRPAGVAHENRFGPQGARSFVVVVRGAAMDRTLPPRPFVADGLLAALMLRCYRALRCDEPLLALHAEELVARLFEPRTACRESGPEPVWLREVDERLRGAMRPPSLAELAAAAGVHPVYLARAFRRHRGRSIGELVRRNRLDAACRLLLTGDLQLAEIAHAVGFADQSHLSREVRAATGTSPARLRRLRVEGRPQVPAIQDPAPGRV